MYQGWPSLSRGIGHGRLHLRTACKTNPLHPPLSISLPSAARSRARKQVCILSIIINARFSTYACVGSIWVGFNIYASNDVIYLMFFFIIIINMDVWTNLYVSRVILQVLKL
jgi:hypothetical protein